MIRIGLMGCGTVAGYGHLPAITTTPGMKLHALFDPDLKRLIEKGKRFGCSNLFQDADAFMKSDIDAVAVTSPAPSHFENVILAAHYGKHVLCEKPLAMTDEQGEQMSAAMERAKKLLVVGFTYRFSGAAQRIKEMAANSDIGDIRAARLVYNWDCHGKFATRDENETRLNMRRHGRMIEGGPAVDCGVHQIDLARWWLGSEVARFTGHGAWVDDYEFPDHTWIHLDHANGAHSMIENSYSYSHTSKEQRFHYVFELIGSGGVIRYLRDNKTFELWTRSKMIQLPWEGEKNFEAMYAQFAAAIETGDIGCFASAKDAIIATRIAREATEQAMRDRLLNKEST